MLVVLFLREGRCCLLEGLEAARRPLARGLERLHQQFQTLGIVEQTLQSPVGGS